MDGEPSVTEPATTSGWRRRRLALGCVATVGLFICAAVVFLLLESEVRTRLFRETPEGEPRGTATVIAAEGTETAPVAPTIVGEEIIPGQERRPGRIAFTDGGRLGTVGSLGNDLRFLSDDDGPSFLFPAWSPDGLSMAVLGTDQAGAGVYVMQDESDSEAAELYFSQSGAPIYIYWRPDGGAVSYIASGESNLNLYLSPPDGGDEPLLLAEGQPLYWDWVNQDSRLFVHTGTPVTGAQLSFVEVGNAPDLERGPGDPGFFQAPGVSTGGAHVAFAELDEDERWLTVSDVATGEVQRTPHQGIVAMGWSPSEQKLAFISPQEVPPRSPQNFYGPLRLLDAETGDVTVLVDETVLAFFWSPDGQTLAYFTPGLGEQVASGEVRAQNPTLGKVRRQSDDFRLSLSVVRVDGGGLQHVVDFRPSELFVRQFLPFFDQYALSHSLWSPDSMALVLPILDDDRAHIYVAPISGSGMRRVADGEMAFWSPR